MSRVGRLLVVAAVAGCGAVTLVERTFEDDAAIDTRATIDVASDLPDSRHAFPCDGNWELVDAQGLVSSCCGGLTCPGRCLREAGAVCDCGGLATCPFGTACCVDRPTGATGCSETCLSSK